MYKVVIRTTLPTHNQLFIGKRQVMAFCNMVNLLLVSLVLSLCSHYATASTVENQPSDRVRDIYLYHVEKSGVKG